MSYELPSVSDITDSLILSLKFGLRANVEKITYDEDQSNYSLNNTGIYVSSDVIPDLEGLADGSYTSFTYGTDFTISNDQLVILESGTTPDHLTVMKITYRYLTTPARFESFNTGSNIRVLIDSFASEIQRSNYSVIDTFFRSFDWQGMSGDELEMRLQPFTGTISRKSPTPSSGVVVVENMTANPITITLGGSTPTTFTARNGLIFNAEEFNSLSTIEVGAGERHAVYVECASTGSDTNVDVDIINTPSLSGLQSTNPEEIPDDLDDYHGYTAGDSNIFAGGTDQETDEELRDRFKSVLYNAEAGTINAIRYALLNIAGIYSVVVTDSKIDKNIAYDKFYVTCYDSNGNIITDAQTSLYNDILEVIDDKAPIGITGVYTTEDTYACYLRIGLNADFSDTADFGGMGLSTSEGLDRQQLRYYKSITVTYDNTRSSEASLRTEIKSRLKNYVNNLDVGSIIYVSDIHELIADIKGVKRVNILGVKNYITDTGYDTYDYTNSGESPFWQDKGRNNILLMTSYKPRMRDTDINDGSLTFVSE